jgi:hypothetical protein
VIRFTLYSRSYCHLCDDMLAALNKLLADSEFEFAVDVIDVDADSDLVALYDELVPVLIATKQGHEPTQLCHYFLDEPAVRSFLIDKKI